MPDNEEKIEATTPLLVTGNLLIAVWLAIATASFYLVNPIFGLLFLAFSAFLIFLIIKRLLCNTCYYCKTCTKGFAKLSMLFLGANYIPGLSKGSILGMAGVAYVFLTVIPVAVLVNSMHGQLDLAKIVVLACLLAVSAYGIIISRLRKR